MVSLMLDWSDLPARHKLTADEFHRMADVGILKQTDRVELIEGEMIDMTPIGSGHAGKTNRLNRLFAPFVVNGLALISVQSPLRLDAYNEPEPDLMLLQPRPDDYQSNLPGPADVLLLIEVADTSLAYDRGTKLKLYARHKIPEVWIIDLSGHAVERYTFPIDGIYTHQDRQSAGLLVCSEAPEIFIDAAELFT